MSKNYEQARETAARMVVFDGSSRMNAIRYFREQTGTGFKDSCVAVDAAIAGLRDRAEVSGALGVTKRTARVTLNLDMLRNDGVFVQVNIEGLSKLKRPTTDAERGISGKDIRKRLQTAGVTKTIDPVLVSEFHSLENKARQNLDRWSYVIEGFRPYRFMTWAAGAQFLNKHFQYVEQLKDLKRRTIASLDERRRYTEATYREIAYFTWSRLAPQDEDAMDAVVVDGIAYTWDEQGRQAYASRMIDDALAAIPSEDDINSFSIDYQVALAQLGSDITKEIADDLSERTRIAALESVRRDINQREYERRMKVEVFRKEVARKIREQLNSQPDPYLDAIRALRERMANSARKVLASLERNDGRLAGPAAQAARNMVETFRVMTVGSDPELMELVNKVDRQVKLSGAGLDETLQKIGKLFDETARVAIADADQTEKLSGLEVKQTKRPARKARKATDAAAVEF